MRTLCVEKPKRSALLSLVALCPWSGIGWSMPCPFSFFAVILRQRDPRNVCNAWKIHPFFSGDIIDVLLWALQQNASECDGSIYEIMFYSFCVLCHVDGQWSRLAALNRQPPGQGPVWRFLLMTRRIIGLEASQWNSNISLACNGGVYIDSRLHLWLSHYGL